MAARLRFLAKEARRDLTITVIVLVWIGLALVVDATVEVPPPWEPVRRILLGLGTWGLLVGMLLREAPLVRAQTAVVVVLATAVEYTFSPLLEAYTYRIGTVPLFVPPGHGLVYLAALALGRSALLRAAPRAAVGTTVAVGGVWAAAGLAGVPRPDVLGAFWFACLLGFLIWGRSTLLYVGAFVVVGYLELLGTCLGTWAWAVRDPVLGVISQGNPPSGAAGGYGWFDLYALLGAPGVLTVARSARQRAQDTFVQFTVRREGVAPERAVDAVE